MSNADRVGLAYVEETEFGTTPSGPAPTLQDLRFTSESLAQTTSSVQSAEIRADRQVTDVIRTAIGAQGDLGVELSYGAQDELFEFALQSSGFSSPVTIGPITTVDADSADNSFNDSGSGFGSIVANQWIKVSGFTEAANNGYFKVVSQTTAKLIVSGGTLVTEVVGDSVTITMGAQIVNGVDARFMSIEREYTDLANEFAIYTGMMIDAMALNVAVEQVITGTFGFMGVSEASGTATAGDGDNDDAPTNAVMNPVDNVIGILEAQASFDVTSFGLTMGNNLRSRLQVATLGPISIGSGKINLAGTFQAYFASKTIADKYLNQTVSSLALVLEDVDGNAFIVDMPRVKYTNGVRVAGGENTDVIMDMAFTAYREPTEDVTIRIARFVA